MSRGRRLLASFVLLLFAVPLVLAGCGEDEPAGLGDSGSSTLSTAAIPTESSAAPSTTSAGTGSVSTDFGTSAGSSVPMTDSGNPAPDFSGTTMDGQQVSLESYRGKPLILIFWASW